MFRFDIYIFQFHREEDEPMLRLAPSFCDMIIENPRKSAFALLFFFVTRPSIFTWTKTGAFYPPARFWLMPTDANLSWREKNRRNGLKCAKDLLPTFPFVSSLVQEGNGDGTTFSPQPFQVFWFWAPRRRVCFIPMSRDGPCALGNLGNWFDCLLAIYCMDIDYFNAFVYWYRRKKNGIKMSVMPVF